MVPAPAASTTASTPPPPTTTTTAAAASVDDTPTTTTTTTASDGTCRKETAAVAAEDRWDPIPLAEIRERRTPRRRSSAAAWAAGMKRRRRSSLKLPKPLVPLQALSQPMQQQHRPSLVVQGLDLAGLLDDECVELLWNAIANEEEPQEPQEINESKAARYSWYGNVQWEDLRFGNDNDVDVDDGANEENHHSNRNRNNHKRAKRRTSIVSLDGGEHALKDFASLVTDDEDCNEEDLLQQLLISIDTSDDNNDKNDKNDTDRNRDLMDAANADDDDDAHMWDPLDVNDMGTTTNTTTTTSSSCAVHALLTDDEDARALFLRRVLD